MRANDQDLRLKAGPKGMAMKAKSARFPVERIAI
jgi:hypothetical protein